MLQLSQAFINRPILSLHTGDQVAVAIQPIINPKNLKIEGFYCHDRFSKDVLVLLYQDIRDVIKQGLVVDDHDVLTPAEELVRLKDIMSIRFELIGKQVVTVNKQKIGKISDYATEVETMYIQKLYATQSILKSLSGGSLSIDRNNIVEITNKHIVIQDILRPKSSALPATAPAN